MRIRLIGDTGIWHEEHRSPGDEFDVPQALGWRLIGAGQAVQIDGPNTTPGQLDTTTAMPTLQHADPAVPRRRR